MRVRSLLLVPALMGTLAAQAVPSVVPADPLKVPEALRAWARQVTYHSLGTRGKVQALLGTAFRRVEDGGLGMTYDNGHTRTVQEVWEERRANCLGLTAFLVASCKSIGIKAQFAEPVNQNRWRREGQLIRIERHLVALVPTPPVDDFVADFMPQLRNRRGLYVVDIVGEERVKAMFYGNRAVELMEEGHLSAALEAGDIAVMSDPTSASAWNIQGVVHRALKQEAKAEASYRKAHQLNPKDGAPIGNLEQQMRDLGRLEEANGFRLLSLETRKRDPYFNAFLAEEAFAEGRLGDALDLIRTAIKLSPHEPELYLAQAHFRLDEGKPEEARKSLEMARKWALPQERERFDNKLAMLAKR